MKWIKRVLWSLLALVALVALALPFVIGIRPIIGPKARPLTDRRFDATPERLARGRYLATSVSGCVYCHGELDWQASGFPVKPGTEGVGRSLASEGLPFLSVPNITPDPETGAGTWTDDMLARSIREGIGHDGRTLFPLMPYTQFRHMSDEDVASIVVYLRSLPPVKRKQAAPAIPFPVNRFINAVPEPVVNPVPQPNRSNKVAYGDYLVRIGACRDCHTPMTPEGEPIHALEFAGGFVLEGPYGKVASRNITPAASGIPYYTDELFLEMMRTGKVKARKIHDQMPWALYGKQPDEDLLAIMAYLRTIPPVSHQVDNDLKPTVCPLCGSTHGGGELNQPAAAH